MRITRETDYAVRCILYLSERREVNVTASEISKAVEIPRNFLPKIIQKLVKEGLLQSAKGVGGGIRLRRGPEAISLFDVVEAIQGPLAVNLCMIEDQKCKRSSFCSVHPAWVDIQKVIEKKLKAYTFRKLLKKR